MTGKNSMVLQQFLAMMMEEDLHFVTRDYTRRQAHRQSDQRLDEIEEVE
jgi:hypothetical protein